MKKFGFIFFSLFAFGHFIFSCSGPKIHNIEINGIGTYPTPLVKPLPIRVGVYYGKDFSTFETIQKVGVAGVGLTYVDKIKMGKANIALFSYILSTVFEKITPIRYQPNGYNHLKDIDLIIEPTVYRYTYPNVTADGVYIHVTYEINFYLPEGKLINSWRIQGTGHVPPRFELKTENTAVIELTQMAMRRVAAKFITGFCNQREIKKIFDKQCNP